MTLKKLATRQLDQGKAGYFLVEPESPVGNQVVVRGGFAFAGAHAVYDQRVDQTSAGFAVVASGFKRYDLVSLNVTGAVQITQGTQVAVAAPEFDGAPGFNLGPDLPDQALSLAYVLVNEIASVIVVDADIFQIGGFARIERDIDGYRIDKGSFGSAPAGVSDIVTALFAGEVPNGSATQVGVVTGAPDNYCDLLDEKDDGIDHSTGATMYGRITEAATVWTLSYFYKDSSGVEQTMDPSTDTAGAAPTDVRLIGTRKTFSRNDPARPLFDDAVGRVSDQLVGDIPTATPTVEGKVLAALLGSPSPPQAGVFNRAQNAGVAVAGGNAPYHTINALGGGLASPSAGVLTLPVPSVSAGKVVQVVPDEITAAVALSTNTPRDDTIPQDSEGHLIASVTLTPTAVGNTLMFEFFGYGVHGLLNHITFHMHVSGTANAFASSDTVANSAAAGNAGFFGAMRAFIIGGLPLVSTTYELYAGSSSGNINGAFYGGTDISSFTVTEIEP